MPPARSASDIAMRNVLGGARMSIRAPCLGLGSDAHVKFVSMLSNLAFCYKGLPGRLFALMSEFGDLSGVG